MLILSLKSMTPNWVSSGEIGNAWTMPAAKPSILTYQLSYPAWPVTMLVDWSSNRTISAVRRHVLLSKTHVTEMRKSSCVKMTRDTAEVKAE